MKIEFNSIYDLKEFLVFINQDKDTMIKEASKELNKSKDELQKAVDNMGKQVEKKNA